MVPLAELHRMPSFTLRYAVKRLRFALPGGARPAVTYGTYRTSSTSVHRALQSHRGGIAVKAHALAPQHLGNLMRETTQPVIHRDGVPLSSHYGNFAVRHGIILPGRPADIVLTVRDPVGVAASLYYSFAGWWSDRVRRAVAGSAGERELVPAIEEGFFGRFPRDLMLDWLSSDVPGGLGWDALAVPFDAERGWQSYSHGHLRILVLRTDVAAAEKERALRSFLDAPALELPQTNSGLGFDSARPPVAAAVERMLRGRVDWVERTLLDPRARHLWGDAGTRRLLDRWLSKERAA
jgi:hypothetical protein